MIAKPGCGQLQEEGYTCGVEMNNQQGEMVIPFCSVCLERRKIRQQIKDALEKYQFSLGIQDNKKHLTGHEFIVFVKDVERVLLGD